MITDGEIADACNKAYLKAGHNAYFGNGFEAGVRFALEQVKKCNIPYVVVPNGTFCEHEPLHSATKTVDYCPSCGLYQPSK